MRKFIVGMILTLALFAGFSGTTTVAAASLHTASIGQDLLSEKCSMIIFLDEDPGDLGVG